MVHSTIFFDTHWSTLTWLLGKQITCIINEKTNYREEYWHTNWMKNKGLNEQYFRLILNESIGLLRCNGKKFNNHSHFFHEHIQQKNVIGGIKSGRFSVIIEMLRWSQRNAAHHRPYILTHWFLCQSIIWIRVEVQTVFISMRKYTHTNGTQLTANAFLGERKRSNTVMFAEFLIIFKYKFGAIWEISNSGRTLTFIVILLQNI